MSSPAFNTHAVVISAALEKVYPEIIRWGEAAWWPMRSQMRFTRVPSARGAQSAQGAAIGKGTRYRQQVLLPFAPSWDVEVDEITSRSIKRSFLNGMFCGYETVSVSVAGDGTRVLYEMHYEVRGFLNRLLWPIVFERLHNANIRAILKNLKGFVESDKDVK